MLVQMRRACTIDGRDVAVGQIVDLSDFWARHATEQGWAAPWVPVPDEIRVAEPVVATRDPRPRRR